MKRSSTGALLFVRLASSVWSLVAFVALVGAFWLPFVYHSNTPVSVGSGVVQQTERSDVDVVLLDSGVYTVLEEDASHSAGDRVEVYDTAWSNPTSSPSMLGLWAMTFIAGGLGLLLLTFIAGGLGAAAADALIARLQRAVASQR